MPTRESDTICTLYRWGVYTLYKYLCDVYPPSLYLNISISLVCMYSVQMGCVYSPLYLYLSANYACTVQMGFVYSPSIYIYQPIKHVLYRLGLCSPPLSIYIYQCLFSVYGQGAGAAGEQHQQLHVSRALIQFPSSGGI